MTFTLRWQHGTFLIALALAGCAQVLGFDDYVDVEAPVPDAGMGGASSDAAMSEPQLPDAGDLFEPRDPFRGLADCQACEMANCAAERAACDADEFCAGFGDEPYPDPPTDYSTRFLPPISDQIWAAHHSETGGPTDAVATYAGCLLLACAEKCELGRDFSCVGEYDWPATEEGEKELRYLFRDEQYRPWPNWDVKLCLALSCDDAEVDSYAVPNASTDERGFAELTVGVGRQLYETVGYVLVQDPRSEQYPVQIMLSPAPILSGFYADYAIFSKAVIDVPFVLAGGEVLEEAGPDDGSVWAFVRDCSGLPARHVTVEVLTANEAGAGYEPCPDCVTVYTNDMYRYGEPDPGRTEITSLAGRAIVGYVPPRHALVVARDTDTQRAVAVQHIIVRANHTLTYVRMYPASRRQLEELPVELR